MNILEVVSSLGIGGTERTAVNFSIGLKESGCNVFVFALSGGVRENDLKSNDIPIFLSFESLYNYFSISSELIDVIHIHSHGININVQTAVCALFPMAKVYEQNVFGIPSNYTMLDCSLQLSQWCMWNYQSFNIKRQHSIKILPNPIISENFYPISKEERNCFRRNNNIPLDAIVFLRIGQPFVAKWNNKIIDIFKELCKNNSNLFLICVGAPKTLKDYSIKYKEIHDKILFIDRILGDDNLRKCYGASDIFLHLARIGESFGIVLAEAMLCELPVVTINTPYCDNSQSEIVGHMQGGLVANRYKGIILAANNLINDLNLRTNLGRIGRNSILHRFSLNVVIESFMKMIENEDMNNSQPMSYSNVKKYLNNAIDKPIPGSSLIFLLKKHLIHICSEKVYRYIFRIYCRLFDKSVQL